VSPFIRPEKCYGVLAFIHSKSKNSYYNSVWSRESNGRYATNMQYTGLYDILFLVLIKDKNKLKKIGRTKTIQKLPHSLCTISTITKFFPSIQILP
jgi:hypothetical protein